MVYWFLYACFVTCLCLNIWRWIKKIHLKKEWIINGHNNNDINNVFHFFIFFKFVIFFNKNILNILKSFVDVDVDGISYVCQMVEIHHKTNSITSLIFIFNILKKWIRFIMFSKIELKQHFQIKLMLELFMCLML
jgi:hypothetical protein